MSAGHSLPRCHTAGSGVCHHRQGATGVQRRLLLPGASGRATPHPSEEKSNPTTSCYLSECTESPELFILITEMVTLTKTLQLHLNQQKRKGRKLAKDKH